MSNYAWYFALMNDFAKPISYLQTGMIFFQVIPIEAFLLAFPQRPTEYYFQRRIQNPAKHLRWSVLREQLMAKSR